MSTILARAMESNIYENLTGIFNFTRCISCCQDLKFSNFVIHFQENTLLYLINEVSCLLFSQILPPPHVYQFIGKFFYPFLSHLNTLKFQINYMFVYSGHFFISKEKDNITSSFLNNEMSLINEQVVY